MKTLASKIGIGISLLIVHTSLFANVVALHVGANDPIAEGWSPAIGPNVLTGPVLNDMGTGLDAWLVDDNGTNLGDVGWYTGALTPAQAADSQTYGWKLTANLRIVDFPDPAVGAPPIGYDASPFISFYDGSTIYAIFFGSQADGDPTVYVPTSLPPNTPAGTSFALEGGGIGYHSYEFLFTPTTGLDLFIDGTEILSDLNATPTVTTPQVFWGVGSSCCTGQANYNLVQLEIFSPTGDMPLPNMLWIFGGGFLALFGVFRRSSKSG